MLAASSKRFGRAVKMNRREPKTKAVKPRPGTVMPKDKRKGELSEIADVAGWSSALEPEFYGAKERTRKGIERKKQKKSGRNRADERFEDLLVAEDDESSVGRATSGAFASDQMSENIFASWEELLEAREALKRRIDSIAVVHGWEGASTREGFLGGIEPSTLLNSIQAETAAMKPACKALDSTGMLLELEALREQLRTADEERDRLEEDLQQSREEYFQARDQLEIQNAQLENLRQEAEAAEAVDRTTDSSKGGGDDAGGLFRKGGGFATASRPSEADPLAAFKVTLSRDQVASMRKAN